MPDSENQVDMADIERTSGPNDALLNNINRFSRFSPTVKAGLYVVISSLMIPAILVLLIWQLTPSEMQRATLQGSVFRGLIWVLPLLVASLIIGKSLRPAGLAENHFGWSPQLTDGLLKTLNCLVWLYLPFQFLYIALETFEDGKYFESLGRAAFIAGMAAVGWGFWGTWSSLSKHLNNEQDTTGFATGARKLLLLGVAITPLAFIVMAAAGYYFTAIQLSWRLIWSVLLTIGITMIAGMISRLLLITQFRIKLRQLDRDEDGEIHHEESIDISEISGQVNRLLRVTSLVAVVLVGWQIWAHVLPAMGYLDQFQLWTSKISATGVIESITLRHLLMAIGLLGITFVLSRNLPGLLEITLLDRLPLDKGGRYAISFVLRYVVGIVGMLMAFQLVGFSWHSVQWLAAGLTLGLGFGLQEIFANLVSGIIILVERPVRVGDLVTVNGVTGTVTRMQLRATTIKDLDHRELIVPNKKFITEDVMNWTLTDRLSRLIFSVGVAYGSDTGLVEKTLYSIARRHRLVMRDPAPQVVFKNFGDSSLDFELRVMIPSRDQFSEVIHQLNMAIDAAFRSNGIEIAFPQQDLHIKSAQPALAAFSGIPKPGGVVTEIPQKPESPTESRVPVQTDEIISFDPPHKQIKKSTASVFKLNNLRGSDFDSSNTVDVTMPK